MKKMITVLSVISTLSFGTLPAFAAENGTVNINTTNSGQQTITINNTTNVTNNNVDLNDIKGHWAEKYIQDLVKKGILNGRDDKKFHPEDSVSRAEFAKMTAKFFDLKNQSATQDFKDVSPDNWAFTYVEATKNYFDAYHDLDGNLVFHPGQGAERQDVAVTLVKILLKLNPNLTLMDANVADQLLHEEFPNDADSITPVLRPYVATAVQYHLIRGEGNSKFAPHRVLKRSEAAALLDRLQDTGIVVLGDTEGQAGTSTNDSGTAGTQSGDSSSTSNSSSTDAL